MSVGASPTGMPAALMPGAVWQGWNIPSTPPVYDVPIRQFNLFAFAAYTYERDHTRGRVPVDKVARWGNHVIGALDDLSALLVLDNVAYSIDPEGPVTVLGPPQRAAGGVIYATVASFNHVVPSISQQVTLDAASLRSRLAIQPCNTIVVCRLTGLFARVKTLNKTYRDINGTIFGFLLPPWAEHICGRPFQAIFLSKDCKQGGWVEDFDVNSMITVRADAGSSLQINFPRDTYWNTASG